jgi:hypothetical protein
VKGTGVLTQLHKNGQRLAMFGACTMGAHPTRTSNQVQLGRSYAARVTVQVPVQGVDVDLVLKYLTNRALIRKYAPPGRGATVGVLRDLFSSGMGTVELQDFLLSSPQCRSSTGAEREQSFQRTVAACQELGFITRHGTLDSFGRVLIHIAELAGARLVPDAAPSPFRFNPALAMVGCYPLITRDAGLLGPLIASLPESFSFSEVAGRTLTVLTMALKLVPVTPPTRDIRGWLKKQLVAAERLADRLSGSQSDSTPRVQAHHGGTQGAIQTLYRPMEDLLLPRLELLVEAGALTKPDRFKYEYASADGLVEMTAALYDPDTNYFAYWRRFAREWRQLTEPADVFAHLSQAYERYKPLSGYAPILECVHFANAAAFLAGGCWSYVEIHDAIAAMRSGSATTPPTVRLIADRFRRPYSFRYT